MAEVVYALCAVLSSACALLLYRAWRRTRVRLLWWSLLCFTLLSLNNVLLVVDLVLVKGTDLAVARAASALAGLLMLLYGLVYDRSSAGSP